MIKIIIFIAFTMFAIRCDNSNDTIINDNNIKYEFEITDTTGNYSREFSAGERFYTTYRVINNTSFEQPYSYTPPWAYFKIHSNDTLLVSSVDGCAFPQVVLNDTLKSGDTLKIKWLAPKPACILDTIELEAGEYSVEAVPSFTFEELDPAENKMEKIQISKNN